MNYMENTMGDAFSSILEKTKAYREGSNAATHNLPLASCPYDFDTCEGQMWIDGFKKSGGEVEPNKISIDISQ